MGKAQRAYERGVKFGADFVIEHERLHREQQTIEAWRSKCHDVPYPQPARPFGGYAGKTAPVTSVETDPEKWMKWAAEFPTALDKIDEAIKAKGDALRAAGAKDIPVSEFDPCDLRGLPVLNFDEVEPTPRHWLHKAQADAAIGVEPEPSMIQSFGKGTMFEPVED